MHFLFSFILLYLAYLSILIHLSFYFIIALSFYFIPGGIRMFLGLM